MKTCFSLKIVLLLFLPIFVIAASACKKEQKAANSSYSGSTNNIDTIRNYKYLALGDSYTIGQSVSTADRFPAQTSALLKNDGINLNNIEYIAVTGWTTVDLAGAINSRNPANDFDIVTLLIGVNDQYQGLDTSGYRMRFSELLTKAVTFAGNRKQRVFVLSIPDYSVTPFVPATDKARVSREINEFNRINKEVTSGQGISYIDITPSTRMAANDPSLIAGDGLHPSGKEYLKWAQLLAPQVKLQLK